MNELELWTIYDHPRDAPEWFVARKWITRSGETLGTTHCIYEEDLEAMRAHMLAYGLTCISRSEQDDPVIIETWL